jgi:hypothetical protein
LERRRCFKLDRSTRAADDQLLGCTELLLMESPLGVGSTCDRRRLFGPQHPHTGATVINLGAYLGSPPHFIALCLVLLGSWLLCHRKLAAWNAIWARSGQLVDVRRERMGLGLASEYLASRSSICQWPSPAAPEKKGGRPAPVRRESAMDDVSNRSVTRGSGIFVMPHPERLGRLPFGPAALLQ